ncbi:Proprotein convertase subtilisin/kexin type 6 [Geodia barretti]|nr:Proprotein convertase subtilisin/kexin type 6 [Geodia barretti]
MVVAFVEGNVNTVTTDLDGKCTQNFAGTSAAAALVSGAIALALEANQSLTWRDVQYLIAYTANTNLAAASRPLTRNGAGLAVSRQYGFGVMDTEAMVTRARHWINVPPQLQHQITTVSQKQTEGEVFTATLTYTGSIQYLEHVVTQISVAIPENSYQITRGSLQIELTSPSGTLSILLQPREKDSQPGEYVDWPFMSVMFWGENPTGQWTLNITTRDITGVAVVSDVEFHFYGVSQVPESVTNIPDQCHSDCKRGCAGEGSNLCDSCVNLRNAHTLECINQCLPGYTERSGYCYDASLPTKQCNSPLKNKDDFAPGPLCSNVSECDTDNGGCMQVCVTTTSLSYCICGVSQSTCSPGTENTEMPLTIDSSVVHLKCSITMLYMCAMYVLCNLSV